MSSATSSPANVAAERLKRVQAALDYKPPALPKVYILGAARTAMGSFHGALSKVTAPELGAAAMKGALEKAGIKPNQIEDVYVGSVLQAGLGQSPARQVALGAGCPVTTEATTVNKVCASGLKAVMLAAQNIQTGHRDLMVAGGMESMSKVPNYLPRISAFGNSQVRDGIVSDGLEDAYNGWAMGKCAEKTATDFSISRAKQDEYALASYERASTSWSQGLFDAEVVPMTVVDAKGRSVIVAKDEEYGRLKKDKVATLPTSFEKKGTITAANASTLNDGASAVVLASERKVRELGAKPLAEIISFADAATDPVDFSIVISEAIALALRKADLTMKDMAAVEINEAFAATVLANAMILDIDLAKLNVRGGGVALGHPLGSSGSRILVTLVHQLKKGEYGVAALCNGGGGSSAMVIKRL